MKKREDVLLFVWNLVRGRQEADQESKLELLRAGEGWLSAVLFCCLFGIPFTDHTFKGRLRIRL